MKYFMKKSVNLSFNDAVLKLKEELKKQGFGVLTEIDVKKTLKIKLDKEMDEYLILGACNPNFASKALDLEMEIGLLLPCNVIIYKDNLGEIIIAAINPLEALKITSNESIKKIAQEVKNRLEKVINNI